MGMRHHWHREWAGRRGLLHDRGAGQRRGLVATRRSTVQESEAKSVSLSDMFHGSVTHAMASMRLAIPKLVTQGPATWWSGREARIP